MKRITINAINRELRKLYGSDAEIVRGNGYFYVWGDQFVMLPSSSVYVCHLSAFTLAEWMREAAELISARR